MSIMQSFRRWVRFLLECPLYYDLRKSLIDKLYWKHPNVIKFIDLLRSENENTLRKLATYIQDFELRTRIYYFNWDKFYFSHVLYLIV